MGRRTKYKKKYAQELLNGLRATPDITPGGREYSWSINRLCWRWGITEMTYHNWRAEFKSFDEACMHGDRDYKMYWMQKLEDGVELGKSANGSLLKLLAGEILGMTEKKQVEVKSNDRVQKIEIEIIPPKQYMLEEQPNNVIDITQSLGTINSDEQD